LSKKVLSKNIIIAIVTLVVIAVAIAVLALTSGGGPAGGGGGGGGGGGQQQVKSIVIDSASFGGGPLLIRLTLRNAGTVTTKITNISVKGTDIEGSQIQTLTLTAGQTGTADVGLSKGQAKTGANELTFTIKTDQGDFEQKYTINYP